MSSKSFLLSIFLVDDNKTYLEGIDSILVENPNYYIRKFMSGESCIDNLHSNPHVVILDYTLSQQENKLNGIEVLNKIQSYNKDIKVVMLTASEELDVAVTSMKYGAYDYIIKNNNALIKLKYVVEKLYDNVSNEIELKDKTSELGLIKIKHKTILIVLFIAVLLFIFTEIIIEPMIEHYTHNDIISISIKLGIACLLKPIEMITEKILVNMSEQENE